MGRFKAMETASPRDFADPVEKVIISGKKDPAGSSSITGLEERYKAGPTDANKFKMDQVQIHPKGIVF
jgi:hypothetical protein